MPDISMKRLAANQKRSLASIKKRLEALACEWDELDNGTMYLLRGVADKVQVASDEMQEFVK